MSEKKYRPPKGAHPLFLWEGIFKVSVVCSSSIYGFWLPLWYLQTLLSLSWGMEAVLVVIVVQIADQVLLLFLSKVFEYSSKTQLLKHINSNTNSLFLEICIAWQAVIIFILHHCNMYWITCLYIYWIHQSRTKTSSHLKVDVSKSKNKLKTGIVSFFIFI